MRRYFSTKQQAIISVAGLLFLSGSLHWAASGGPKALCAVIGLTGILLVIGQVSM